VLFFVSCHETSNSDAQKAFPQQQKKTNMVFVSPRNLAIECGNKNKRHPAHPKAKSFYANKIPVEAKLSVRHGDATIIYGGFDFPTRGGVKSEKRRPRPQEGNGRAWPAFIVRIANQQIKICDVEWQGKWELGVGRSIILLYSS